MLRKFTNFLKRLELASDAVVLESIPQSAQAAKVRRKYGIRSEGSTAKNNDDAFADIRLELNSELIKGAIAISELAKAEDPEGMFHLGDMHENGFGVDKDLSKALSLYCKSAEAGFIPAIIRLGDSFFSGTIVSKSDSEAARWYAMGAQLGDDVCQKNIGLMHLHGIGVTKDHDVALNLLLASAQQGNFVAQRNIGEMYLSGTGVAESKKDALMWFVIADKSGDPKALDLWSNILMEVPAAECRKAMKAAEDFVKMIG